jgi:general secretion pathway protein I
MIMKQFGFTLLEVLIAMVILALAFTTSFLALSSSARNLLSLQDKTAADWVGLNVIARAQTGIMQVPKGSGTTSGTDKMFAADWSWKLVINPTADKNTAMMTVTVGKGSQQSGTVTLTGYLPL